MKYVQSRLALSDYDVIASICDVHTICVIFHLHVYGSICNEREMFLFFVNISVVLYMNAKR